MFSLTLPHSPDWVSSCVRLGTQHLPSPHNGGSAFASACQTPLPEGEGIGSEAITDSEVSTSVE
jgi:hypothetical protein